MLGLIVFLILSALLVGYYLMALWPISLAFSIANSFDKRTYEQAGDQGYYKFLDQVKVRRHLVLGLISVLIFLLGFLDLVLINRAVNSGLVEFNSTYGAVLGGIIVFSVYAVLQLYFFGKVRIPKGAHKKEGEFKNFVENLAITAGTSAPKAVVLSHTTPTIFSIHSNFHPTTIYVTTGLLNLATKNELEAAVAHEIAYHLSKRNSSLRLLENLLLLLKLEAFALFFLLLINVNFNLVFLWFVGLGFLYIRTFVYFDGHNGDSSSYFETLVLLLNPAYLLYTIVAYVFYYLLSWQENIFADLKAVDLTRYPEGLYGLLQKLAIKQGTFQALPKEFDHLYLTAECSRGDGIPDMQLSVPERLAILRQIDNNIIPNLPKDNIEQIACAECGSNMASLFVNNMYDRPTKYFYCQHSGHIWFDDGSFFYLSGPENLENLSILLGEEKTAYEPESTKQTLLCPRCGVALHKVSDAMFPKQINVFHCESCQGDFTSLFSFANYVYFRRNKEKVR